MLTTTPSVRASRSASIGPRRESSPAGSSLERSITCALTRTPVREEMWVKPSSRSTRRRRSHAWPSSGCSLVEQPRAVVEEVLPRAGLAARAEALELVAHVVGPVGLDPGDDLVLARPRPGRDQVHQRVRVRGDEVHRLVRQRLVGDRRPHRRPPAAREPRVAGLGAAEHPDAQVELPAAHLVDEPGQPVRPGLAHPLPVLLVAADHLRQIQRLGLLRQLRRPEQRVELVPLQLVGDQRRESRRRGPRWTPAARPARPTPSHTSAAGGRGPRATPSPRSARNRPARTARTPARGRSRTPSRSTPAAAAASTGTRPGPAVPCRRRARAATSSSPRARARAPAAASRRRSAAASCRSGGRARPRPRPDGASHRTLEGRADVGRP